jgi:alpha-soluble NSF attachment protein
MRMRAAAATTALAPPTCPPPARPPPQDIDINFAGSREANLLETLAEALSKADEKQFATAVAEFDAMTRLDGWKTAMLLKVKRRVGARQAGEEAPEDEDDDVL